MKQMLKKHVGKCVWKLKVNRRQLYRFICVHILGTFQLSDEKFEKKCKFEKKKNEKKCKFGGENEFEKKVKI